MAVEISSMLVLGGARSGKSHYAQMTAEGWAKNRVFIATAESGDAEMEKRIAAHRAERGAGWRTTEAPLALAEALRNATEPGTIVLVDCLTLWLSNLMLAGADVIAETRRLADCISALRGPVIFVSNEVGSGIVPSDELARQFRDAQGRLNQTVAASCNAAVLVVAGLPVVLKPGPALPFKFQNRHG